MASAHCIQCHPLAAVCAVRPGSAPHRCAHHLAAGHCQGKIVKRTAPQSISSSSQLPLISPCSSSCLRAPMSLNRALGALGPGALLVNLLKSAFTCGQPFMSTAKPTNVPVQAAKTDP